MGVKAVLGDLQIVVERHSDVLRNNALPFRFLVVLRIIGYIISYLHFARLLLWLHPYQIASIELWRIATSTFCGHNVLDVLWTVWCLHFGTNLVRLNNTNESLLKLYAITQGVTTFVIVVFAYLTYILFDSIKFFYIEPLVGMTPICASVMVLMKQFLPDTIVLATPLGRIKYAHLPFLAIFVSFILALTKFTYFVSFLQITIGVQVSWTYLRFYKPHETDEIYGDGSEHFTWASLFPSRTQLFFTLIGKVCFRTLARMGVCKRQVRHVDLHSLQSGSVGINLPALENSAKDSERRRQKALKELNDRLNKTRTAEVASYGNWDDGDDDEPTEVTVVAPPPVSNVHSSKPAMDKESMA
ncbi:Transmembrane protein 115 [Caenorhabditis elegans]|uniref:Transmembrane protein 115 n=2 Tax=Caenorhabditis elegans TaxID=6239 RepID=Q9U3K1_CAEEL|nr:Transmembrane protein 115 [Caenorhabditis elegans]CAB54220.1 Transmembrane protein 115 [Caenorhabditis elegans]|eukprot:NP_001255618.1 Uncharacterized protein CELE_F11A10.6 [Caenorhabditis elegans]